MIATAFRAHYHALWLRKKLQRETRRRGRFDDSFPDLNSRRRLCGLLTHPLRALVDERMLIVAGSHDDGALIIQQLRDGFLRGSRRRETAIEDVALPLDFAGD